MEMIDVLKKLQEIAETKPELVKDAVDNVQRTNPTEAMNPKQQAAIAIAKKEKMKEGGMKDYLHDEAEKLSREEFIKKHGESLKGFYDAINGPENGDDSIAGEGKMMKKEEVKEDMHITTDSPQEASMLMQILKMAGLQPVDAKMMGMEPPHGSDMDPGAMNKQMDTPNDDDAMGTMQMAKMRDMMKAPEEEKAAETFANEPEEKVQDDIDLDKDGNKTEPMKKAAKDKEEKEKK
jgi:hypothetical protein